MQTAPFKHRAINIRVQFDNCALPASYCISMRLSSLQEVMEVPTIDLALFLQGPFPDDHAFPSQKQVSEAARIDTAFRTHGFLYLSNIGLPSQCLEQMFASAKKMFSSPASTAALLPFDISTNVGFLAINGEQLNTNRPPDQKEIFHFSFRNQEPLNFMGCPDGFTSTASTFWDVLNAAADAFTVACALALGLPYDVFTSSLRDRNSVFRLLHYPPASPVGLIRAGEHTDYGFFTFLFAGSPGLEAKTLTGSSSSVDDLNDTCWEPVPCPPAPTAIVNLGALTARLTNDVWLATAHRAVVPDEAATKSHRYSIACFFHPDADAVVAPHPKFTANGSSAKYAPVSSQDYINFRLQESDPQSA